MVIYEGLWGYEVSKLIVYKAKQLMVANCGFSMINLTILPILWDYMYDFDVSAF